MTHEPVRNTSYLKLLKVEGLKDTRRRYTLKEDSDKKELIESVKNNLMTSGVEHHMQAAGGENTEVKVDAER